MTKTPAFFGRRRSIVALALSATLGCSTSYTPRTSQRIAVIQVGGTPSYVRDGKVYPGGLLGGEIEEAVHGNPVAEQHARDYKAGTSSGLISVVVGGIGMGVGLGLLATGAERQGHDANRGRQIAGAATLGTGLAAYIAGLVLITSAQPHLFDAINVYNDGVAVPPAPSPPARPAPTGAQ
jgi:hypothetical protein